MASCDSMVDHKDAKALGWSTFLVHPEGQKPEVIKATCQGGKKTTCGDCKLCDVSLRDRQVHVTIPVHGQRKKHFAVS